MGEEMRISLDMRYDDEAKEARAAARENRAEAARLVSGLIAEAEKLEYHAQFCEAMAEAYRHSCRLEREKAKAEGRVVTLRPRQPNSTTHCVRTAIKPHG